MVEDHYLSSQPFLSMIDLQFPGGSVEASSVNSHEFMVGWGVMGVRVTPVSIS